jgi:hypothetical protein
MAIRDSFPVTVADGDQLNDGYFNGLANDTRHLVTRAFSNSDASTTSSSMQDYLTLTTPAALKSSQTVFIEAIVSVFHDSPDVMEVELWDDSASTQLALYTPDTGYASLSQVGFLQATVTLASVSNTKSIQIRFRRASGSTDSVVVLSGRLTCMLVES